MDSQIERAVIVLIHAAWHQPIHFAPFASQLRAEGFEVLIPRLATAGPDEEIVDKTLEDDVRVIHDTIGPFVDAGREIVLILHSFSGLSGTKSAVGYTVNERKAQGLAGGVRAMVYIAAAAAPVAGMYGMQMADFNDITPDRRVVEGDFTVTNDKKPQYLYHDVEPAVTAAAVESLTKQTRSLASFNGPCRHAASDIKVRKIYVVVCDQDQELLPKHRVGMAMTDGCEVVRLECGHSPFLKKSLVNVVKDVAR